MTLEAETKLDRLLESGRLDGAFFLYGDAARLREEAARRIIDAAVDPATRDFNLDLFRGGEVDPPALSSALAMPPLMSARRVVSLSEAQELSPRGRKVVEGMVAHMPAGLCFVITATIPSRSKAAFYKTLWKRCAGFEFASPREAEVPGWLLARARDKYGFHLSAEAAEAIAGAIGNDLSLLEAELEKLANAVVDGNLGLEQVRALVPNLRAVNRWQWLDRVAARDYRRALDELPRLLADPSESAVRLLIAMIEQHVYLGLAVEGGERLVTESMTRANLKWKARVYRDQARAWDASQLEGALRLMHRADWNAKSGGRDAEVMEQLLLSLAHLPRMKAA